MKQTGRLNECAGRPFRLADAVGRPVECITGEMLFTPVAARVLCRADRLLLTCFARSRLAQN